MRTLIRDVGVALVGFGLVFGAVFLVGRALLETPGIDLRGALPSATAAPTEEDHEPTADEILGSLQARRAATGASGGVMVASGAFEGEYDLPRIEILGDFCPDCGSGVFGQTIGTESGLPVDLDVRFSGEGVSVRVIADHVEIGVPRTDDMTIVVNSDRLSFMPEPGECRLELLESSHSVRPASFGNFYFIRSFEALLQCEDIAEIRGGGTVSVLVAFALESEA